VSKPTSPDLSSGSSQLGFHGGRCAMWVLASRDCYDAVSRMSEVKGPRDGLAFAGRTLLGVLALELALGAARWVVSNTSAAASELEVSEQELAAEWGRVRSLRSDVVAHMETWVQDEVEPFLMVNSSGITVRETLVFEFEAWRRWLDILEPWALTQGQLDRRPVSEASTAPAKMPLQSLRRPR